MNEGDRRAVSSQEVRLFHGRISATDDDDLLVFEDDPYGHLRYDGEDVPTLFSMDTAGRVVYA